MPDNWGYVAAAYGLTTAVLVFYWRHLVRTERQLNAMRSGASDAARSRTASRAGHPGGEPSSRHSRQ